MEPTVEPTMEPSLTPTNIPTNSPTISPTSVPTSTPTAIPTNTPTEIVSINNTSSSNATFITTSTTQTPHIITIFISNGSSNTIQSVRI